MLFRVDRLSPHLEAQAAPLIAAARKNGLKPEWLIITGSAGARRRRRQERARAYKLYEATCRRERATTAA